MEEKSFILIKATTKEGPSKCPTLGADMSENHWYISVIFRCYLALTTGNISYHHLTKHARSESQIKLLFFLNWHYWYVKVSLNVYFWAPLFSFCIACESCLFVITNSWTRCLWWWIDFILKILKFSHISTSACLIYASSWKLKYVGRSNLALWTGLFWIKDE